MLEPLLDHYNRPYAVNVAERPRQRADALRRTTRCRGRSPRCPARRSFRASRSPSIASICPADSSPVCRRLSNAPQVKPLPGHDARVRPGNGAPLPASSAYGIDEADGGVAAAPGRPPRPALRCSHGPAQSPAYNRGRIAAAELRSAVARSAGAKRRRSRRNAPRPTRGAGCAVARKRSRRPRSRRRMHASASPPQNPNSAVPGRTRVAAGAGGESRRVDVHLLPMAPRHGRARRQPPQPAMSAPGPASMCARRPAAPDPTMQPPPASRAGAARPTARKPPPCRPRRATRREPPSAIDGSTRSPSDAAAAR